MSQLPPELPHEPSASPLPAQPIDLAYETPQPSGNAALLVRLAAIFLLVSAGLDLIGFAWGVISAGINFWSRRNFGAGPAPGVPVYLEAFMIVALVVPPLLSLGEAGIKGLAAWKFFRAGTRQWGWGLAAGIASCCEIWSCPCCFASWATGIYTIVILCLPHVRAFLAAPDGNVATAFPVSPGPPENPFRPGSPND